MEKSVSPCIPTDREEDETASIIDRKNSRIEESNHVWLFSAIAMVLTFRHLCEAGYIFPMRLLAIHITAALAITRMRSSRRGPSTELKEISVPTLLCSAVHIAATAGALIFAYQAILHLPNAILVGMILTLPLPFLDHNTAHGTQYGFKFLVELVPRYGLIVCCIISIFLYENQLVKDGIISTILAASCVAVVRLSALLGAPEYLPGPRNERVSIHTYGLILSLPIAAIVLFAAHEAHHSRAVWPSGHWILFAINVLTGGFVLMFGTPFKKLVREYESASSTSRLGSWRALTFVMVLTIDNASLRLRPFDVSPWQWLAYVIAFFASVACLRRVSPASDPRDDLINIELGNETCEDAYMPPTEPENNSSDPSVSLRAILFYILCFIPILLVVYHRHLMGPVPWSPEFPPLVGANRTLDIVFARYAEGMDEIAAFTEQLLALPVMTDIDVRVVIYNKGNRTENFEPLRAVTDDLVIHHIPNVEKEGETYIFHILNEWNDLAHHTLFLQARPHEPRQLLERVRDYYGPDTGFLALSYTGMFCESCDRCHDRSTWYEKPEVFHDVYQKANKEPCHDISLTYRGQFIVSKERIRNLDRGFLKETRQKLINEWTYGYSFERLWGVAFQCPRIPSSCPTLESGSLGHMGSGGRADCQCLDH